MQPRKPTATGAALASLVSLALAATAWSQTPVPITNAGFEDPVVEIDGGVGPAPTGWAITGSADIGVLNPAIGDFAGEAPEGSNVAFVANATEEAGLTQVLSGATGQLQVGASYSLTVKVGNTAFLAGFPGYKVQLLADGTLLAEDDNKLSPGEGVFLPSTVTFGYNAELHAALVGKPLEIRLVSKAIDNSEVNFDDVQLTVFLTEPLANTGGPYVVAPGGFLTPDASGSLPSDGQEITKFEWDITNDDNFVEAAGPIASPISYLDLKSLWGMGNGPNPIQLRVTDSGGKQATVATTVTLVSAVPTPGFGIYFNAAEADGESDYWNDLVEGNPTGLGLLLDKAGAQAVNRVAVTGSNTLLTHAYEFPGGFTGTNNAGARLVASNTATPRSFATPGWNTQSISMEIWFKPDTITPPPANGQILFEDGGGTGLGFFVLNNQVRFKKAIGGDLTYNLSTDPLGVLDVPATADFIQVVGTYNSGNGAMQIFVNGTLVASGTGNSGSWSGGDAAAFGTLGGANAGGLGGGQQNTQSFDGRIALIRVYSQKILNAAEVLDNYRSFAPDLTAPTIATLSPGNNAPGVYPGIGSLAVTFDEDVELTGAGSITIKNLTDGSGSSDVTITLPDASVAMDGARNLVITLASNLAFDTDFAVHISGNAVRDIAGNPFAGIGDDTTWAFRTAAQNLNPPVITARSPEDDALGVPIGANIVATFDQHIVLGSGDIVIKDLDDDSTTLTIAVTDPAQVSVAGNVLTVNPSAILAKSKEYAVQIPSSAVRNFSDVAFAGSTNETDWNFKTANLAGQLGILNVVANGGINPATNREWRPGDRYRLVFISSDPVDPRAVPFEGAPTSDWNNIATWNAKAQAFADNASGQVLSGATWQVVGSTATVNARDNTATNPTVHGSGHPIMLIDGSTIVAGNFNELWPGPGKQIRNVIRFTQNKTESGNQHINDAPAIPWPLTGTNISGTVISGGHMRDISAGGSIRQGQGDNTFGWIDRANWTVAAQSSVPMAIYCMSDPLFVLDLDDATAPTMVLIEDNVMGGPIVFPDGVVVYTVTFNEAMLPSTVDAGDFGNASATPISISSVVQQDDPAVFQVTVTPLSPGTIQLQINQDAALTDLNGNPLNTSAALIDSTIITVTGGTPYDNWADEFAGLTNPNPDLDFDAGGLPTGIEWVVGGDPTDGSDDAGLAPTLDNASDPDFFIYNYRRSDEANTDANTAIAAEYSTDLGIWTPAAAGDDIVISEFNDAYGVGIDRVEVKIRRTLAVNGKLFVRLKATVTQP